MNNDENNGKKKDGKNYVNASVNEGEKIYNLNLRSNLSRVCLKNKRDTQTFT